MKKLLQTNNLSKTYVQTQGFFSRVRTNIHALDNVSFSINQGTTMAVVGESGSGKSTLAKSLVRLVNLDEGSVEFNGVDLLNLEGEMLKSVRKDIQMIFQDPYASLNPRLSILQIMEEPLLIHNYQDSYARRRKIENFIERVGLKASDLKKYPHQFSGGQRQRIGIARALILEPKLVICDEPVSALDVAVQAQILNLLRKLQKDFGLTYLFISHDLGVVQHMCDSIAVMYMGKIVEYGPRLDIFNVPQHPYTQALLSAVPSVDKARRAKSRRILISGDPPDPVNLPDGCRFANRCSTAKDICRRDQPKLDNGVACHFPGAKL